MRPFIENLAYDFPAPRRSEGKNACQRPRNGNPPIKSAVPIDTPPIMVWRRAGRRLLAMPNASAISTFLATQFATAFPSFFYSHESLHKLVKGEFDTGVK
jgi:hypothetical protein